MYRWLSDTPSYNPDLEIGQVQEWIRNRPVHYAHTLIEKLVNNPYSGSPDIEIGSLRDSLVTVYAEAEPLPLNLTDALGKLSNLWAFLAIRGATSHRYLLDNGTFMDIFQDSPSYGEVSEEDIEVALSLLEEEGYLKKKGDLWQAIL